MSPFESGFGFENPQTELNFFMAQIRGVHCAGTGVQNRTEILFLLPNKQNLTDHCTICNKKTFMTGSEASGNQKKKKKLSIDQRQFSCALWDKIKNKEN